jgi:hypothetical protein
VVGVEFATGHAPAADDLVVAGRQQLPAVGCEQQFVAGAVARPEVEDQSRRAAFAAVGLGVGGRRGQGRQAGGDEYGGQQAPAVRRETGQAHDQPRG